VLLAAIALVLSLTFAGNAPQPSASQLPPTQPGLSHDEGAFLVTTADDGSQAVYFIAGNIRHSILWTDMQIELQLNPLWPVFSATPDDVLAFPEGTPVGAAPTGQLGTEAEPAPEPVADDSDSASADEVTTYTVQRGDSAFKIARRFGIDEGALIDANGIINPNRVYVGQVLTIPGSSS
jgi:nucleoid-associated protein YgaU